MTSLVGKKKKKSRAYCRVFDDEDEGWVQIGNLGDKSNSFLET